MILRITRSVRRAGLLIYHSDPENLADDLDIAEPWMIDQMSSGQTARIKERPLRSSLCGGTHIPCA